MSSFDYGQLEGLIPLFSGVFGFLFSNGSISVSKNPTQNEAWLEKYGSTIGVISQLLIAFGIIRLIGVI